MFTLQNQYKHARAGVLETAHGAALTPMFMPVGTQASVKALDEHDVQSTQPQVILANTYHLYLRPGAERIARLGGLHQFMRHDGPILTDSGGFQVFSLGVQLARNEAKEESLVRIDDDDVEFRSHLDGSRHRFTPTRAIEIQQQLGSDIMMAFDECLSDDAPYDYAEASVEKTFRWAQECVAAWEATNRTSVPGHKQLLFGIAQGALHPELRRRAVEQILSLPVSGLAFGGETVGYNMSSTVEILDWTRDLLPEDKPRYAMGLGRDPQNIIDAVWAGYDMFDCVAPTRLARNGALYVGHLDTTSEPWQWVSEFPRARLQIGAAQYAEDTQPIQADCDCSTCQFGYTRAYLHHLYRAQELSYYRLASIHNVRTMVRLAQQLRERILQ